MNPVIDVLTSSEVDRLERLWGQLLAHHSREAAHLAALGPVRPPEDSWLLRRAQYLAWLREPLAAVLVARDGDQLLGYAVVRVLDSPGSWQWGDRVGVLETLVVDDEARGSGVGQALIGAVRARLAESGVQVMKISVVAGNEGALRFYRREGAVDFMTTLVMPVPE
ncbi:GNAT family N-acetyltransferase [Streptomyces sp. NBC_01498]|uniref:GNAT family N-acetyltransferase n=1 Tax=Streptomyces sp. NBC_01498 TaxID=2975870 RepID=UPI002E7C1064|nr:GNAT family N-acetyltransferase [Streptomyces sp. NBC_01498]WTL24206.1 GNAT family N-acetyltransferase [Streptomyces sp. NBC_01498]